jgi:hypothetical protein
MVYVNSTEGSPMLLYGLFVAQVDLGYAVKRPTYRGFHN